MGKHSAPESPGFWRAAIIAGMRYLLIVALLGAVAFGVYKLAFDRGQTNATAEEDDSALPTDPFLEETPTGNTSPSPTSTPSPTASARGAGRTQVLDASNSPGRLNAAERKLREAGYEVAFKGNAATPREKTTVFYHPGNQEMAEAVGDLLGATLVQPVGALNLDRTIPVTVIIGPDYAG